MNNVISFSYKIEDIGFNNKVHRAQLFTSKTIKSVPHNYDLRWDFSDTPAKNVTTYLQQHPRSKLIIDRKVFKLYFNNLDIYSNKRILLLTATEANKSLKMATKIFHFLEQDNFSKTDTVLVVGGGIIADVAGFAATCFRRGIAWMSYPTTLLAMVDSCLGGKTSLNFNQAKNQLGLFSCPAQVIINPKFLTTLSNKAILSGLGEAYKTALLGGETCLTEFVSLLGTNQFVGSAQLNALLSMCLEIKKSIIEHDQFEHGIRKSLNYGHTLGHAIEAMSNFAIPHGQAVTLGIMFANYLSMQEGLLPKNYYEQLNNLALQIIDKKSMQIFNNLNICNISDLLLRDKKIDQDTVTFVLLTRPGHTIFKKIAVTYVENKFKEFCTDLIR